ncbi:MAG: hypothetical protein QME32_02335 [Endomicrobiia bacterium]|nr:hypothetical protein [Endomicrobiia bacterium]
MTRFYHNLAMSRNAFHRVARRAFTVALALFFFLAALSLTQADYKTPSEKDFYALLEAGDFVRAEKLISPASASGKNRLAAWLALYRGDYVSAAGLSSAPASGKDFLSNYSAYMASVSRGFVQKESEHFILRHFPEDAIMADFALERLEKIRSAADAIFGYSSLEKVLVEIYPDKKSFAAASTLGEAILEKSGTVGICKFNRLMILSPRNFALGYNWLDTLAHEYSHFAINRVTGYNCPLWVHEGVARWTDTLWRSTTPLYLSDYSSSRLASAARADKLIPFAKMSPSLVYLPTREEISLAFAQVGSFVDFIVERYGRGIIEKWLEEMKKSDEKRALSGASGESFAKIERAWRERLKSAAPPSDATGLPDLPLYGLRAEDELIPADLMRHARLGDGLRRRGNFEGALWQYERAYAAEKNPVIAVKIARAKLSLGRDDEAEDFMRAVADGNQGYLTPRLVLAEIAVARGDAEAVRRHSEEAFMINPFYPGLYDALKSFESPRRD